MREIAIGSYLTSMSSPFDWHIRQFPHPKSPPARHCVTPSLTLRGHESATSEPNLSTRHGGFSCLHPQARRESLTPILLRGGIVLRTVGDTMRYIDTCRDCIERSSIRLMLQQTHW